MFGEDFSLTLAKDSEGYLLSLENDRERDLDKSPMFFPVCWEGALGTVEFQKRQIIFHPANGRDKVIDVKCFYENFLLGK
jgi:hypothetical protein